MVKLKKAYRSYVFEMKIRVQHGCFVEEDGLKDFIRYRLGFAGTSADCLILDEIVVKQKEG